MAYLQLKHLGVYLHGFDMRDTCTNLIINYVFFKALNECYQITYAVKTVENLFTWGGHERYKMMMEINQSSLDISHVHTMSEKTKHIYSSIEMYIKVSTVFAAYMSSHTCYKCSDALEALINYNWAHVF